MNGRDMVGVRRIFMMCEIDAALTITFPVTVNVDDKVVTVKLQVSTIDLCGSMISISWGCACGDNREVLCAYHAALRQEISLHRFGETRHVFLRPSW